MLLALDIGNTNITVGAFSGVQLLKSWRLATDTKKTADEYGVALSGMISRHLPTIDAVIYGSVVPALAPVIESAVKSYFGIDAVAVLPKSPLGFKVLVDHPREVGVDRLLNALAAYHYFGGPAIVLDFGTATTFDCISARGDYLGGAILIGPLAAARALAEFTAQLPRVELRKTKRIIGKNTVECIQAGLYDGYLGMIDRVLRKTLAEMKSRRTRVVATGGLAAIFAKDIPLVRHFMPELTLQGLRLAHERMLKVR